MKVIVLGASDNPARFSYKAIKMLKAYGHDVFPVGIREAEVEGEKIITSREPMTGIDTLTLYVGPQNQLSWYDFILKSKPKRIIFNPGTENPELYSLARNSGIECIEKCTLVMLSTDSF